MATKKPPTRDPKHKQLRVCSKCAGYMRPQSAFQNNAIKRNWKDDTYRRSFGGVGVQKFCCEKCGHVEVFQSDELGKVSEDE